MKEGKGQRYVPRAGTHSTYLNYLFRTGVFGLFLIVGAYGLAFYRARRAGRSLRGEHAALQPRWPAWRCLIAAAHAVILSLYVEPIYTLTVSLLLGLAAGMAEEVAD